MYLTYRFQQLHGAVENKRASVYALLAFCIFLTIFVVLPISLTGSEDNVDGLQGYPWFFLGITFAGGVLYGFVAFLIYRFSSGSFRTGYIYAGTAFLLAGLAFGFLYQTDAGVLDNFVFSKPDTLAFSATKFVLDSLTISICLWIAFYLLKNRLAWVANALIILALGGVGLSAINLYSIHERVSRKSEDELSPDNKLFSYSKNGKNVLLLFVDGAMSGYLPDIFREDPSLVGKFSGFNWYSNVVSTGNRTINGLPALFGGFDYTVSEINKRNGGSLKEKVSAAYKVYADNFSKNNYQVLYSDPFWFGLARKGDCELFNELYEKAGQARCIHSIGKQIADKKAKVRDGSKLFIGLAKQYLGVSLFKIAPSSLKQSIYADGQWLGLTYVWKKKEDKYLNNFFSLASLGEFSDTAAKRNTFTFITNELTRAPLFLKDDCIPDNNLKSSDEVLSRLMKRFSTEDTTAIYQTTKCTVQMVGKYMEWLKANGVYDNTMIVVASDHGWISRNPSLKDVKDQEKYSMFQSFLMVKNFGASSPLKESKEFIANASVPGMICDVLGGCLDKTTGKTVRYEPLQGSVLLHETPWQGISQKSDAYVIEALHRVKRDVTKSENWESVRLD